MQSSTACRILAFTVLATSLSSSAKSPDQADTWLIFNKITHKRSYRIETRDRKCVRGTITGVTTDGLTAAVSSNLPGSPNTVTFPRADVLRVAAGQIVYYSGRSSWSDVSSLRMKGRERLKVVTTDGKTYKVKPPYSVSDEGITLNTSGKSTMISKGEIVQVYDIVAKPLTDTGEYLADELGPLIIFDPDLYVYGLHLEEYVSVLLYDASDPEDNSPVQCVPR
jgi:hypothetical protein